MTFRVGQKVVCIDASGIKKSFEMCPNRPVKGCVYTVRSIFDDGLLLEEVVNPPNMTWKSGETGEAGWCFHRFRPIVERKDEISFTEGAPKDSEQFDNRRKIGVDA
jgi:hypothetical protein